MVRNALLVLAALVAGFAGAGIFSWSGLGDRHVERYLVANPDLLPQMMAALERKRAEDRLASVGGDVRTPYGGAVLGNPNGSKTLVKFTDYNCGYCRASAGEVQKMIAADPDLRVVIREWPIFEGSDIAARMALAAAKQGKYREYHLALFESGDTSMAGLEAAAQKAGLDLARLKNDAGSAEIGFELSRNAQFAQELGFTGTPSWVAGSRIIEGAVPAEALASALSESAASES
ncbi:DsbA family protein [Erythrobacter litoralis]|uniref:27kDa outer membrane protein n=1 Tax=Erythrobacter litoralis (strain HTCC2594) TaxID=314225 RepID=Q2N6S1_ERYLH|nr:DsbA family protein [Erythrobacter litoralis]ABC64620.1 27kDa outer membrane protein [Erythrobacter litoralis HTCC2594]